MRELPLLLQVKEIASKQNNEIQQINEPKLIQLIV